MESPLYKKLKTIQDAINYEIDQHYINAKGKKNTFSDFIVKNTKELAIEIEDRERLKSLINLFYSYSSQDIATRISVIHKAQEILRQVSEEYKNLVKPPQVDIPPQKITLKTLSSFCIFLKYFRFTP